jgi:hypothetical protein
MKYPEDGLILVEGCCPIILSVSNNNQCFAAINKIFLCNFIKLTATSTSAVETERVSAFP